MKINYNYKPNSEFGDLKLGDAFLDEDGDLMMKIETVRNFNTERCYNAVDLSSGFTFYFEDFQDVTPCPNVSISVE